ncbi:peptidoglycan endopeptidase [Streptomyces dangxiongensis]|uniref:Peptidoglycan endopeptidase n=2 Tax=Streptomyces dangxiongensis TaxID=1442032 RepID=A0A3G2JMI0_9ACTN|nr:peptidoglycan endopeptidase [Streptomyces dangxiongensis]
MGSVGAAAPAEGRDVVAPRWGGGAVAPALVDDVTTPAPTAPTGGAATPGRGAPVAPPRHTAGPDRSTPVIPPRHAGGQDRGAPVIPLVDAVVSPGNARPEVVARDPRDPKAVKAAVQRKLAHARVVLARRTAPGSAPSGADAAKAGKAVAFARAQLGKPCVWGAAGPGSYDCSGLTQAAWKSAGVTLPRTARDQAAAGTTVPPADARPGDLVLFHDDRRHVGLCTGDGMMIHAPRPGAYVREEPMSSAGESAVHSVVRPV